MGDRLEHGATLRRTQWRIGHLERIALQVVKTLITRLEGHIRLTGAAARGESRTAMVRSPIVWRVSRIAHGEWHSDNGCRPAGS